MRLQIKHVLSPQEESDFVYQGIIPVCVVKAGISWFYRTVVILDSGVLGGTLFLTD